MSDVRSVQCQMKNDARINQTILYIVVHTYSPSSNDSSFSVESISAFNLSFSFSNDLFDSLTVAISFCSTDIKIQIKTCVNLSYICYMRYMHIGFRS